MSNLRSIAIFSHYAEGDGGFRYARMQYEYLMSGQEFFILADVGGVLGFVTRLYLSKVVVRVRRSGLLNLIDRLVGFFILKLHVRVFLDRYPTPFLGTVFCMSEAPLALEFLTLLKRRGLISRVHYSMLDLPWSFNCSPKYKNHVRQRTKQLFGEIVSSADFVTPEMQSQFDNDYFSGPSFNSFSAIEMVINESHRVEAMDGAAERRNICYAGAFRASSEFQFFLDLLKRGLGGAHIDAKFDVYGPHDPTLRFNYGNVEYKGNLELPALREALQRYKYGFVPMSFDPCDAELVETSFPGKAWLYVACGVVPVVYAPASAAISKFFKRESIGIVLCSSGELREFLETFSNVKNDSTGRGARLDGLVQEVVNSYEAFKTDF